MGNEVWTRETTKDTKKRKQTDSPLKPGKDEVRKGNTKNALRFPAYMNGRVKILEEKGKVEKINCKIPRILYRRSCASSEFHRRGLQAKSGAGENRKTSLLVSVLRTCLSHHVRGQGWKHPQIEHQPEAESHLARGWGSSCFSFSLYAAQDLPWAWDHLLQLVQLVQPCLPGYPVWSHLLPESRPFTLASDSSPLFRAP